MERTHNKKLVPFAKDLRKNMTKEEKHLWYDFLKLSEYRFQRQKVIGDYIADFYCAKAKLIIELDGAQHYEEETEKYDNIRTEYFAKHQIKVIRFSNYELKKNFKGICEYIDLITKERISELE